MKADENTDQMAEVAFNPVLFVEEVNATLIRLLLDIKTSAESGDVERFAATMSRGAAALWHIAEVVREHPEGV
jgi:hypothetical protein